MAASREAGQQGPPHLCTGAPGGRRGAPEKEAWPSQGAGLPGPAWPGPQLPLRGMTALRFLFPRGGAVVLEASGLSKSDWLPRGSARLPAETPGARRPLQQLLRGRAAAAGSQPQRASPARPRARGLSCSRHLTLGRCLSPQGDPAYAVRTSATPAHPCPRLAAQLHSCRPDPEPPNTEPTCCPWGSSPLLASEALLQVRRGPERWQVLCPATLSHRRGPGTAAPRSSRQPWPPPPHVQTEG